MLNADRYIRQLPLIGVDGQRRLRGSSVLVVGLGGLGSIISMYLAGAGVGKLVLVDFDTVSISDLHRQLLYTTNDVGRPKVELPRRGLGRLTLRLRLRGIGWLRT